MLEIITPAPRREELTDRFINATLVERTEAFANGEADVNNHIDAGYDEVSDTELKTDVTVEARNLILASSCRPDFVVPVPNGATGWGCLLINGLRETTEMKDKHIMLLRTRKTPVRRQFASTSFITTQIQRLTTCHENPVGIVIDDVSSDGGTGEAMADFISNELGLEVGLVMSLLFRGDLRALRSRYQRASLCTVISHTELTGQSVKSQV